MCPLWTIAPRENNCIKNQINWCPNHIFWKFHSNFIREYSKNLHKFGPFYHWKPPKFWRLPFIEAFIDCKFNWGQLNFINSAFNDWCVWRCSNWPLFYFSYSRISYYCANEWLPMLSDWDLDAAILSASDPCLQLALVKASQREKVTLAGMIY